MTKLVPSANSGRQSFYPTFHYLTEQSCRRKVTITGRDIDQPEKKRERKTKTQMCEEKLKNTVFHVRNVSACEVTCSKSSLAAGEKQGGRWPGISIHLAQEPSPPKRKLTPAG